MPDFPDHSPNFSNPTAGNPGVPEKNAASKVNDSQFDDKESNFDVAFLLSLAPNTRTDVPDPFSLLSLLFPPEPDMISSSSTMSQSGQPWKISVDGSGPGQIWVHLFSVFW